MKEKDLVDVIAKEICDSRCLPRGVSRINIVPGDCFFADKIVVRVGEYLSGVEVGIGLRDAYSISLIPLCFKYGQDIPERKTIFR